MKFRCKECSNTTDIYRVKLTAVGSKLVCKDAYCCDEYMEQVITDEYKGVPDIKRNEEHMKGGDRLWNDFKHNNVE